MQAQISEKFRPLVNAALEIFGRPGSSEKQKWNEVRRGETPLAAVSYAKKKHSARRARRIVGSRRGGQAAGAQELA